MSIKEIESFIQENRMDLIQQNKDSLIFRKNVIKNINSIKLSMKKQRKGFKFIRNYP